MELRAGQVAVVTGAASGIGLALAEAFAERGLSVALVDVEEAALAAAATQLQERGVPALAARVDVSVAAEVEALAERVYDELGGTHILCNNAGVGGDFRAVWEQSLEGWEWVLGVNLWGVIHGIRSFVPRMLDAGEPAHVVNTASIAGVMSMPLGAPYHVSKHGVVTMSESMAFELRQRKAPIGVSVLCPGYVRTGIADAGRNRPDALRGEAASAEEDRWVDQIRQVLARGTPPGEVAGCVLEAIEAERFYVFSHPEWLESAEERFRALLAQEAPVWSIPRRALEPR